MTLIDQLLTVSAEYGRLSKLSTSRVSTVIFNDGKILPKLGRGAGGITTSRLEHGLKWLSNNWPNGAEWPAEVTRPEPNPRAAA